MQMLKKLCRSDDMECVKIGLCNAEVHAGYAVSGSRARSRIGSRCSVLYC